MISLSNFVCATGSVWACSRKLPTHLPTGENHLLQKPPDIVHRQGAVDEATKRKYLYADAHRRGDLGAIHFAPRKRRSFSVFSDVGRNLHRERLEAN